MQDPMRQGIVRAPEPYYSTRTRESDGAIVTNRGQVIGAPFWTQVVLAEIDNRLKPRVSFRGQRVGRA